MTPSRDSGLRSRLAGRTEDSASLGRRVALIAGVGLLAVTTSAQADVGRLAAPHAGPTGADGATAVPAPSYLVRPEGTVTATPVATSPLSASTGAVGQVPSVAAAAYQRAATVINQADTVCHLTWTLLAGLGRVESDHGRVEGNVLDASGTAVPGIFGRQLNGHHGVGRVFDTDRGALDGDPRFDRAVGPLQFLPATWRQVAVDADGDGRRDPQDINDAALAAAVYLCAGNGDLERRGARRAAVTRLVRDRATTTRALDAAAAYAAAAASAPSLPMTVTPIGIRASAVRTGDGGDPAAAAGHEHGGTTSTGSIKAHGAQVHHVPAPHPTSTASPSTPTPPTDPGGSLSACETQVLPPAVTSLLGGVLRGTLTQVVAALRVVPVVGSQLAEALARCVQPATNG